MASSAYMVAAVVIAAVITFALRAGPFALIQPLRASRLMRDLSHAMPGGFMLILLVYLLRAPVQESAGQAVVAVTALVAVIALHWWRANAFLSIFAGSALYVVATSLLTQ